MRAGAYVAIGLFSVLVIFYFRRWHYENSEQAAASGDTSKIVSSYNQRWKKLGVHGNRQHFSVDGGPFPRVHRDLRFCDANPIVQRLNKTHILDLEYNEWREWDESVLERTLQLARVIGTGHDAFLNDVTINVMGYPISSKLSNEALCGKKLHGIVEAFDLLFMPIDISMPCPSALVRLGNSDNSGDTGKLVCDGDILLRSSECLIYSLGSNNQFDFEEAVSKQSTNCQVHTFDCTSEAPKKPIDRVTFEKVCLGGEDVDFSGRSFRRLSSLMSKNGHSHLNLLKMDIESFEMDVFDTLLRVPFDKKLPYQIVFETHNWHVWSTTALLHSALLQQLTFAGYRPVWHENNVQCPSCNEHTFVRVYC
jgi:hypothetical protein